MKNVLNLHTFVKVELFADKKILKNDDLQFIDVFQWSRKGAIEP